MERPRLAIGASVLLHAAAYGAMVALKAVSAPAAITPPRALYVVLPEADTAGRAVEHPASGQRRGTEKKNTAAVRRWPASAPGESTPAIEPRSSRETERRPALAEDLRRLTAPPPPVPESADSQGSPPMGRVETASLEPPQLDPSGASTAKAAQSLAGAWPGRGGNTPGAPLIGSSSAAGSSPDGGRNSGARSDGDGPASRDQDGSVLAALPRSAPSTLAVPRYNDNVKPVYPWRSRLRGEQGTVLLSARVSEGGRVSDVRVVQSSGAEALDEAARTAVKRWTFHPARRDGSPVEMDVHVPVQFRLEK